MREIPIVFGSRAARLELELLKWIHTQGDKVSHKQIFKQFTGVDKNTLKREERWWRIKDVRLASAIDDLIVYGVLEELEGDVYRADFYQLTPKGIEAVLCVTDLKKAVEYANSREASRD